MIQILQILIRRFKRWLFWLWKVDATPGQRARGLAAGVFCGCFPLFGLQTLLGILLAGLLNGNKLLAASATWISNPLTYLPLYWFNYQLGCIFLGKLPNGYQLNYFSWKGLFERGWIISSRLLLGSTLVGLLSAVCLGTVVYWLLIILPKIIHSR